MASGTAIAAIVAAAVSAAGTTYAAVQSHKQQEAAKKQEQKALIAQDEEKKEALQARKDLIDQQRETLQGSYATRKTQTPQASGLVGRLEDDILG